MRNKYTFWDLCNSYDKIEIPIIQRDYAQGRNTTEVLKLRDKFINDYLIEAIVKDENIELDFVYGSVLIESTGEIKQTIFIPLDGQQRLTTLFLLYFLVAVKEERLHEIKQMLSRFSYETRPSAHDFCSALLNLQQVSDFSEIKAEIEDANWFNEDWKMDPTVSGMLVMLETLAKNDKFNSAKKGLLDRLLNQENKFISFYFTDLEQFGLTENLYIRMNARGKMLTEFENFKSEFSKIIRYNHTLLEAVKDKIEYQWVDNLWSYRAYGCYTIDDPFMAFLNFMTEMLYFKDAEYRAATDSYEKDFLDFRVLKQIYSVEENLKILIFAFDYIEQIKNFNEPILWKGESLSSILKDTLYRKRDTSQSFILFLTILYSYNKKPVANLKDYIRVVRNLIVNTDDNSKREWPRLISSLQNLISDQNVYELLSKLEDENLLVGFNVDQRKEEIYKSKLFLLYPTFQNDIFKIEDNENFSGNISNILKSPFARTEKEFADTPLKDLLYDEKKLKSLVNIYVGYKELSHDYFMPIWGNLLTSGYYKQTFESRLVQYDDLEKHPAILIMSKNYVNSKLDLQNYIIKIQKEFILKKQKEFTDFTLIRNVKDQLYIYYIISQQIYETKYYNFFKNNNYNFGWLSKKVGYKSLFSEGIEGCTDFPDVNPIFQLYNALFRYNEGIKNQNTLEIEIIGGSKKRDPFDLIIKWALKSEVQ